MEQKKILIVIPARYQSSRLPAKPLIKIAGTEMIKRVAQIAQYVCEKDGECDYVVATDHAQIEQFCINNSINVVMTRQECQNGTERCWEAVQKSSFKPELVINLQGDNPLCPPWIIEQMIQAWRTSRADLYSPCVVLSWDEYDKLVETKRDTPFSGTTVMVDRGGYALAFSKNIIPAIRKPEKAREMLAQSPVKRHIGLYAYTYSALEEYFTSEESCYEQNYIEGLEQMRFLYNGKRIKMVEVDYRDRESSSGVDSPEDILRVEEILKRYGEFDLKTETRR